MEALPSPDLAVITAVPLDIPFMDPVCVINTEGELLDQTTVLLVAFVGPMVAESFVALFTLIVVDGADNVIFETKTGITVRSNCAV